MKLHELFEPKGKLLLESSVTLRAVEGLHLLKDPKTGQYYTGEVNVTGPVDLWGKKLAKLPVKFGWVSSDFSCNENVLTTLEGAPQKVGGEFNCVDNKLVTLEGAPQEVGEDFYCDYNKLTSLKGAPQELGASFHCANNALPSLEGIHKIIKKIDGVIYLHANPIERGGIGLILIEGLRRIDTEDEALLIINRYLGQGKKGVLLCQEELIEAGYEEFARL